MLTPCDLYDMLERSAERFPDKAAVIDDEETVTYAQMKRRVDALAAEFYGTFGLRRGMQAGVLMVNSAKTLSAFYALARLGCVAVMMNTKYRESEIRNLLSDLDAKLIVCDEMWLDKVQKTAKEMQIPVCVKEEFPSGEPGDEDRFGVLNLPESGNNADLPCVMMHTSGTTGKPKGILVTQRNIMEAAYGYEAVQKLTCDDVTVLSVPLFHILGLSCVSTMFIHLGGTIILSAFYNVRDVLDKIRKYRATHFHSVPAIYLQMLAAEDPEKDLSSVRTAICGGAPVSEEDAEAICRMMPNAVFRRAYGMTETAGSGTLSLVHRGPLHAVPNMYCTVADKEHHPLPAGVRGEIVFHGAPVARGRWKAEDLTEDAVFSGDVGWMDEEGNVFVEGRIKDIINRGGEKIFPIKIELLLEQFPGIREAAVYAVRSEQYGEVPAAALTVREGEKPDPEAMRRYLKEHIASFEMPVYMDIMDSLPVTQNGKIKKAELRRQKEAELFPDGKENRNI